MEDDEIIQDAYYLINLFSRDNLKVTQPKLQKLMYFFEAAYMNVMDINSLYSCEFMAMCFGPIALPIYERFKNFEEYEISLFKEQEEIRK